MPQTIWAHGIVRIVLRALATTHAVVALKTSQDWPLLGSCKIKEPLQEALKEPFRVLVRVPMRAPVRLPIWA